LELKNKKIKKMGKKFNIGVEGLDWQAGETQGTI
jgi:hypothetical protein